MNKTLLLALALVAAPAAAGPPWISVELPANPFDRTTRGQYLVVRAYHHDLSAPYEVTGTAEGLVDGRRRSIALTVRPTGESGKFAVARNWPAEGVWVLKLQLRAADEATALVGIGVDGEVTAIRVPTGREGAPRAAHAREVDGMLTALAAGQPMPRLAAAGWGHDHGGLDPALMIALVAGLVGAAAGQGLRLAVRRMRSR